MQNEPNEQVGGLPHTDSAIGTTATRQDEELESILELGQLLDRLSRGNISVGYACDPIELRNILHSSGQYRQYIPGKKYVEFKIGINSESSLTQESYRYAEKLIGKRLTPYQRSDKPLSLSYENRCQRAYQLAVQASKQISKECGFEVASVKLSDVRELCFVNLQPEQIEVTDMEKEDEPTVVVFPKPIPQKEVLTGELRPLSELEKETAFLWLINRQVFHPRGFHLQLVFDENLDGNPGQCLGWKLLGDGKQTFTFPADGVEEVLLELVNTEFAKHSPAEEASGKQTDAQ